MLPTGKPPALTESDRVYRQLRDLILRGKLAAGEALDESALMVQMACGRTPLREAVRNLVNDGLVEVVTRRGTYVTQVNLFDSGDLLDLRVAVERVLARSIVKSASVAQIAELSEFIESAGVDSVDEVDFDAGFHDRLLAMSGNVYVTSIYWRLVGESMRLLAAVNAPYAPVAELLPEFRAAYAAIAARDAEALESALVDHVESFVRGFGRGMANLPAAMGTRTRAAGDLVS